MRAYHFDWSDYEGWCRMHCRAPIPAELTTLTTYLESLSGSHACATIHRRLSAIGSMHRLSGISWNGLQRQVRQWLHRQHPELGRPPRQLHRFTNATLRGLLATCDGSTVGRRDRALLLIGFAGAMRPGELAALQIDDVDIDSHGLRIRIRCGRNNEDGEASSGIALFRANDALICPQRALQAWHANGSRKAGSLFVSINSNKAEYDIPLTSADIQQIIISRGRLLGLEFRRLDRLSAVGLRFSYISSA